MHACLKYIVIQQSIIIIIIIIQGFIKRISTMTNALGLFKCIVNDLFFYNNQKSATSVFVIPTSVLVISCKSVSSIQKP